MVRRNFGQYSEIANWLAQSSEGNFLLADVYWISTHQNINLVLKLMVDNIMKMKVDDEMN